MPEDIQRRGHCQCCGNEQAVVRGFSSKHGYTVKYGWFTGVCQGQFFKPIEQNRQRADEIVAEVMADVAALRARAADLAAGRADPETVKSGRKLETVNNRQKWVDVFLPFAEGSYYEQERAVEDEIRHCEYRAREGESFAAYLKRVADTYHGAPLTEVAKKVPAAQIQPGEKRDKKGRVLTALYQDGARVYYRTAESYKGWLGSRAWRDLPLA